MWDVWCVGQLQRELFFCVSFVLLSPLLLLLFCSVDCFIATLNAEFFSFIFLFVSVSPSLSLYVSRRFVC